MIERVEEAKTVAALFEGWQESCIISCIQGVMGWMYANQERTAAAVYIDSFAFFAGKPDSELAKFMPEGMDQFVILVPQNKEWENEIEKAYGTRVNKVMRYAIKKEPGIFDREKLTEVVENLPKEYSLRRIDEELFQKCLQNEWSKYFVCNYENFEEFEKKNALGVVVMHEGKMVAGVSSYSSYHEGIEIEVDTSEPYRRKGLAYACSAKLILECMDRNLYPNWDAQNKWSVGLAEKLGYHFSHEYPAYELGTY